MHQQSPVLLMWLASCCLLTSAAAQGAKSKQKCEEYAKAVYIEEPSPVLLPNAGNNKVSACGIVEVPLVVGGVKTGPKEFPHMAVIGYGDAAAIKWMCGGSLISEQFVLTAGHCVNSRDHGAAKFVRVGEVTLDSTADDAKPQDFTVAQAIPHPEYKAPSRYNDIALLKLDHSAAFSGYVRPACLYVTPETPVGKAIATGFGRTDYASEATSKDLLKVLLTFIDTAKCSESFKGDVGGQQMTNGVIDSQLCAGEYGGGKDTCQGDSGGPLQIVLKEPYCMYSIVGVTSFGKFCGFKNSPAIYTKVAKFIPWIESVVWP